MNAHELRFRIAENERVLAGELKHLAATIRTVSEIADRADKLAAITESQRQTLAALLAKETP